MLVMKLHKFTTIAATAVLGVSLAAAVSSPVFAWHPKGQIVKSVQNVTAGGALSDANDAGAAVAAKPGDTLKYVVVVTNAGAPAAKGDDDMAKTVMTDTLPAGIELVSNPSQRTLKENLGTLVPGQSVTKEYLVKVTATTAGVIENKACFTGDSIVNDNPQKGCDVANVKVTIPVNPTYTCDKLTVTKLTGRQIDVKLAATASNGATIKSISYNFGDGSAAMVTNKTDVQYTYQKDGNFTVSADITFDVNGQTKVVSSSQCAQPVAFSTPAGTGSAPTVLPNTGAGNVALLGGLAVVAGYAVNLLRLRFRAQQ
jgi:uncharacterized repeat protein (TIGR01451 family)